MSSQNSNESLTLTKEKIDSVIALYSSGKLTETIELINTLNIKFPNEPLLLNILGATYKAQGNLNLAIEIFKKALKFKKDYPEVYNNLGISYLQTGQFESALDSFNNAISIAPKFLAAQFNLAITYKKLNNSKKSCANYRKARILYHKLYLDFKAEGILTHLKKEQCL